MMPQETTKQRYINMVALMVDEIYHAMLPGNPKPEYESSRLSQAVTPFHKIFTQAVDSNMTLWHAVIDDNNTTIQEFWEQTYEDLTDEPRARGDWIEPQVQTKRGSAPLVAVLSDVEFYGQDMGMEVIMLLAEWLNHHGVFGDVLHSLERGMQNVIERQGEVPYHVIQGVLWEHCILSLEETLVKTTFDTTMPWEWQEPLFVSSFQHDVSNVEQLSTVFSAYSKQYVSH